MADGIEDEFAHVREEIQRLARLRYQQRGFTEDQQAEYEALISRRDKLALDQSGQ
jgi:regulator of sirC expression with transglutaminase-like and TPR domain